MDNNINSAIDAIIDAILEEEGRMSPKKKLVVRSAILCFAEYGYDATSTRMISDKAGVAEATIVPLCGLFFVSRLAFADRYAPLIRIILQEYLVNADLRQMLHRHVGAVFLRISNDSFGDFFSSGEIRDFPLELMVRWMISLFAGYYLSRTILAPGEWDDEAEIDAMLDFIMPGIAN